MPNQRQEISFKVAINELLKAINQGQRINVALRLRKTPLPENMSNLVDFCVRKSNQDRKNLEAAIRKYFKDSKYNRIKIKSVINSFLKNQPHEVYSITKSEYKRFKSGNGLPFSQNTMD